MFEHRNARRLLSSYTRLQKKTRQLQSVILICDSQRVLSLRKPHNTSPRAVAPGRDAATENTHQSDSPESGHTVTRTRSVAPVRDASIENTHPSDSPESGHTVTRTRTVAPCTQCINREHSPVRLTRERPCSHTHESGSPNTKCINIKRSPVRFTREWPCGHTHESGSPLCETHQQKTLTNRTYPTSHPDGPENMHDARPAS